MEIGESFSSQELMPNKRALVDIARSASFGSVLMSALCIEKATAFNILFLQRTCEVMLLYKGIITERRKILIDLADFFSNQDFYFILYFPGFPISILIERRKILIDLAYFSSDLYISYLPGLPNFYRNM